MNNEQKIRKLIADKTWVNLNGKWVTSKRIKSYLNTRYAYITDAERAAKNLSDAVGMNTGWQSDHAGMYVLVIK